MTQPRRSPIFTIFLTVFIDLLGVTIIIPILAPLLVEPTGILGPDIPIPERNLIYGFLLGSFSLFQFFSAPLLGSMSDRFGRRKVLFYSLFVSLAGYIMFATAIIMGNLILLFVGRSIAGLASGNLSVIYSAIADVSKPSEKAKNFGLVGMAFGLGFVIGPFLGGILSDPKIVSWFDYYTPFVLSAILVTLNILMVYRNFPETLTQINPGVRISPLGGFRNIRKGFRNPALRGIFIVIFLFTFGFAFFTQFFQLLLIEKFAYTRADIGYLFAYIGVLIAITQGGLVRILARYLPPARITAFSLLGLTGAFLALLLPDSSLGIYLVMPGVALFQGLATPNLSTIVSNEVPAHLQGETLGIQQSMQSLAQMMPPIIGGFAVTFALAFPIWLAAACTFLALLMFLAQGFWAKTS